METTPDALLGTDDAARMLGVDDNTIYRWISAGRLPAVRTGAAWRVRRSDAEALASERARHTALLTVREAARRRRVGTRQVMDWIRSGSLPAALAPSRGGPAWMIRPEDLDGLQPRGKGRPRSHTARDPHKRVCTTCLREKDLDAFGTFTRHLKTGPRQHKNSHCADCERERQADIRRRA